MPSVEILAKNVQRLRIKKFGSVEKACEKTGISLPRWYRIEQGKYPGIMDGRLLDELAKSFKTTTAALLTPVAETAKKRPIKK